MLTLKRLWNFAQCRQQQQVRHTRASRCRHCTHSYNVLQPLTRRPLAPRSGKVTVCENEPSGPRCGGEAPDVWPMKREALKAAPLSVHSLSDKRLVMKWQQMCLLCSHSRVRTSGSQLDELLLHMLLWKRFYPPTPLPALLRFFLQLPGLEWGAIVALAERRDQSTINRLTSSNTMDVDKWSFGRQQSSVSAASNERRAVTQVQHKVKDNGYNI